ncbi:bifunctional acetate--CoA ligase family protein/GNAT family N-acetyltransferase [Desulfobacterota bacterium AH_259_B03_O07]|nr:bifunctional acetate--CoA ligase family protein/GNAT family N-acetyltransferase [Desulfobacterota bacterium AH_259_B03_O07]
MSTRNLDKIFKPQSIALIGASKTVGKLGNILFRNLIEGGFKGPIFPVNPKYRTVNGKDSFNSVIEIKDEVDLAIIVTPIEVVPEVIKECVRKKILGTIIISAGGKEIGEQGKIIEEKILLEAAQGDIRIIGPNCLGIIHPSLNLNASFSHRMALSGNLAFISQSGALCTAILDRSFKENIGFSHFISIGSMADVDFGDLIDYLGGCEEVTSIILYIESLTNTKKFMSAARAVSRVKPIIALKAGRSQAGAQAAASHTGAMAGEDEVYDAAFKRAGVVRVLTINELFNCAESLAKQPRPRGPRLGIVTNAGGPGVMAADKLEEFGHEPAILSEKTIERLNSVLPPHWSKRNPVDIIGDATPGRYLDAVSICLNTNEIDGLLVIFTPQAVTNPTDVASRISESAKGQLKPIFAVWMGGEEVEEGISVLNKAGIPTYDTPEDAVNIFMHMYSYSYNLKLLQETPRELHTELNLNREKVQKTIKKSLCNKVNLLSEVESKELLENYGIPINRTLISNSPEQAAELATDIGFPAVLKIHSPDITHKTDAGGVILDLNSKKEVEVAFKKIVENARAYNPKARIDGATVQRMIKEMGYEIILGSKYDPLFGPVILFGMGGIMTEVIGDKAIGIPPLNSTLAKRLMEETKVYKLISGFRNRPPVNLDLLEEILLRLSHLVTDFPEITEIDINPLYVNENSIFALDARVIIKPSNIRSPEHMVICPYPHRYETHWKTKDEIPILFRPIKPEDEGMMLELFNTFSKRTIQFRFFELLKSMPHEQIVRYTQIDYDRDMAIVAVDEGSETERILGVGRLSYHPNLEASELSVVVGDHWQGKGLGKKLLLFCIEIAKEKGVSKLWGDIMAENEGMIRLCKKLGFKINRMYDEGIAQATMDLN